MQAAGKERKRTWSIPPPDKGGYGQILGRWEMNPSSPELRLASMPREGKGSSPSHGVKAPGSEKPPCQGEAATASCSQPPRPLSRRLQPGAGQEHAAYSAWLFPQERRLKHPPAISKPLHQPQQDSLAVKDFKERKAGLSPITKNQLSHLLLFYRCLWTLSAKTP